MLIKNTVEKRRARVLKAKPQVRKTFPPEADLLALGHSVMKRQLHPLLIFSDDLILDGELRWRALMLANPEFELDVIVVTQELTPAEISEVQIISAMHSTSLSVYDQSLAYKEWMERNLGATAKQLAEKIDRDQSTIGKSLSLWKTIPAVIKAAEAGHLGLRAWHSISLHPEAEQAGILELHLSGMSAGQIAEVSRKKRTSVPETPSCRVSRIKCPLPSGTVIQITGESMDLSEAIEATQEWLRDAKKASDQGLDAKTFERVCRDKAKHG